MNKIMNLSVKLKAIIAIIVVLIIVVTALAISKKTTSNSNNQTVSNITTKNKSKKIRLSDALSSKQETIWYDFNLNSDKTATRDTGISHIIVTKDGYMTVYQVDSDKTTISTISKLSNIETIKYAKKSDRTLYNQRIKGLENAIKTGDKTNVNSFNFNATESQINSAINSIEKLNYTKPTAQKIKIIASNNGQNHNPTQETIEYKDSNQLIGVGNAIGSTSDTMKTSYKLGETPKSINISGQSQWNSEIDGQRFNGFSYNLMTKVKSANLYFSLDNSKGSLITSNKISDSNN